MHSFRFTAAMLAIGTIGACAASASAAMLDDLVVPPWQRFAPYTTFQEWDFNDPGQIPPDGGAPGNFFNEGKPNDTPFVTPGSGVEWDEGEYFGDGGENSFLDFFVPNWIDQEPLKLLWIQINGSWNDFAGAPQEAPRVIAVLGTKDTDQVFGQFDGEFEAIEGSHRLEQWSIRPNPDFEFVRIYIPFGASINQVVIDTISFPAPGAVAAFGIAGFAAARRRR